MFWCIVLPRKRTKQLSNSAGMAYRLRFKPVLRLERCLFIHIVALIRKMGFIVRTASFVTLCPKEFCHILTQLRFEDIWSFWLMLNSLYPKRNEYHKRQYARRRPKDMNVEYTTRLMMTCNEYFSSASASYLMHATWCLILSVIFNFTCCCAICLTLNYAVELTLLTVLFTLRLNASTTLFCFWVTTVATGRM